MVHFVKSWVRRFEENVALASGRHMARAVATLTKTMEMPVETIEVEDAIATKPKVFTVYLGNVGHISPSGLSWQLRELNVHWQNLPIRAGAPGRYFVDFYSEKDAKRCISLLQGSTSFTKEPIKANFAEESRHEDWLRWEAKKEKKKAENLQTLPTDRNGKPVIVPSDDPDYQPKLSWTQIQKIMSSKTDVLVHDGEGNLRLTSGKRLPRLSKYGTRLSEDATFELIEETEFLYREVYKEMMKVDPELIPERTQKKYRKFPSDEETFFEQTGYERNCKGYDKLIRAQACDRKKSMVDVFDTFKSMQDHKVQPNRVVFNALLYACAMKREPDIACDVMREMGNTGLNPNQMSYINFINACVKNGEVERALSYSKYIAANSQWVSPTIYNLICRGFLKQKKPEEAMKVFDYMMQVKGEHPDVAMYTTMMDYYVQTKNVNGAFDLFREMEQRGYKPNLWTFNQLIRAAANGDIHDSSYKRMYEAFDEMLTREITPNVITFHSMLTGCSRIGDLEAATEILKLMECMGVARDRLIYNAYLMCIANSMDEREFVSIGEVKNLGREERIKMGENLVQQMKDEEIPVQRDTVNLLLNCYTRAFRTTRAMLFLDTMSERFNVIPNKGTYKAMWRMLVRNKRYEEMKLIFDEWEMRGYKHYENWYRDLVFVSSWHKDPEGCERYLKLMYDNDIEITRDDVRHLRVCRGTRREQEFEKDLWRKEKEVFKRIAEAEKQTGKKFRSLEDVPGRKNKVWRTLTGGELKDGPRLKPEIFWDHDQTIGGLDDPW